jgi:hypothetical protein
MFMQCVKLLAQHETPEIRSRPGKWHVTLRTDCTNQKGVVVLTGEATIKYMHEAEVQ